MLASLTNIFKISDLRRKILFTLMMLVVFRIGSFVPVPNVNVELFQQNTNQLLGLLNTFSGGALHNFSIFAMGIMPYITASIIMQLMSMDVVPKLTQWAREGEVGRRKIATVTRYATIILGLIQSVGMTIGFNNMAPGLLNDTSVGSYALIALTLTAGTAFMMWMGEQITEKGIGNGISILIVAGIVAGLPNAATTIYTTMFGDPSVNIFFSIVKVLLILLVVLAIIVGVIFMQQGLRKIPVQYAKRVVGRKMYGGQSTHIPLKINSAGVIPVIFAVSLVMFPSTIAQFWVDASGQGFANWIYENFQVNKPLGMTLYAILILGFTYFYTFVQINPVQMAENMRKNGGYIPGIRPGKNTEVFITRTLNRLTLAGALFLMLIAILPFFFGSIANLPQSIYIGGTSLLIVVGVCLDTMKQIESQMIKRHYQGFIK
ncbi:preprotein translocase subunit SecY [Brevibacillus formosus]|uniref:preprotein translocase subunit SecY n=1 Tax=Brevibacillus TaxID=55080 RepID=UPI000D10FCA1|nr:MULTISPECIES: preprotein translocase subunit SecY [Brevibacillus]MBG9941578.1 preprotein translocase subunit SecY [Brevibacillus formosus]MED1947014.1 preprotein translocase subunit SecY [Brevibacillus formosus]MED2000510.1 preprotein translocase subunit SecY [Brevibacillus formosus]MED2085701.1 preprotein translocase subunit SecY [Brevibacillus formosus]PSK13537.1 preprotein translocase subunit SecY [Brevibacillus sp. NRRL NRS-603]